MLTDRTTNRIAVGVVTLAALVAPGCKETHSNDQAPGPDIGYRQLDGGVYHFSVGPDRGTTGQAELALSLSKFRMEHPALQLTEVLSIGPHSNSYVGSVILRTEPSSIAVLDSNPNLSDLPSTESVKQTALSHGFASLPGGVVLITSKPDSGNSGQLKMAQGFAVWSAQNPSMDVEHSIEIGPYSNSYTGAIILFTSPK